MPITLAKTSRRVAPGLVLKPQRDSANWQAHACVRGTVYRRTTGTSDVKIAEQRALKWFFDHKVIVHSDQGSQFTSIDWSAFLKAHNIEHSMSRRGNCHDNAVAESFFNLLKRERVRRRLYKTRDEARKDIFDYIEMFYNPKRKHVRNGMMSPIDYERQQKISSEGV